ncbi:DUF6508 domain-containing protein [Neobacillus mesonae]|nr:DUF6508 domain-containing protein [Neobacillus mesonae]
MPYDANITTDELNKLLQYLEYFQGRDHVFYYEKNGYLAESEEVLQFRKELDQTGFLVVFDWSEWIQANERFRDIKNDIHDEIKRADLNTLRKLMTSYIRGDRFNEGLFIQVILQGHIKNILMRLQEIKNL